MPWHQKFTRFLFTVFALTASFLSHLIIIPFFFIVFTFGPPVSGYRLFRWWGWYHLQITWARLKVYGRDKLDPKETYIFISNHRSMMDIPVATQATGHHLRFLAKEELKKRPFWG